MVETPRINFELGKPDEELTELTEAIWSNLFDETESLRLATDDGTYSSHIHAVGPDRTSYNRTEFKGKFMVDGDFLTRVTDLMMAIQMKGLV